ncbi:MAG TPA: hypothetical protein VGR12_01055, partial [Solirubrobacteraceae bacterium]|nr:hypothetical protein [Solirubrobacteraceae bacterium]
PHIFAHRDVTATECPGELLYGTLPDLRTATAARIARTTSATFRVAATPTDVTVARGTTSAPISVRVDRVGEFAGDVALSGRGLPDGAVAQVSPATVRVDGLTTSASATLTIATTKRTPTGTYLLRVEGTAPVGDGLTDTRAATVRIQITRR